MICKICQGTNSTRNIVTYKSVWTRCDRCGCYSRQTRRRFPLQWLAAILPGWNGPLRSLKRLLGPKEMGVDYYRYYEDYVARGDRSKWKDEYADFRSRMAQYGITISGKRLLDVSGEPGFFGLEAQADGAVDVTVTGLADNVCTAIKQHLGIEAFTYDFNNDRLKDRTPGEFDVVTCRYAIGFCERLDQWFVDIADVMRPGGYLYVSFSPPSLAVCSKWMFDDYTYLRQHTHDSLLVAALSAGFSLVSVIDEGSRRVDSNLHWVQKALMNAYRHILSRDLLRGSTYSTELQHNVGVLLRFQEPLKEVAGTYSRSESLTESV